MKHIYKANRQDVAEVTSILADVVGLEISANTHKYIDDGKRYDCYFVYINGEETRFTKKLVDNLISHECITKLP